MGQGQSTIDGSYIKTPRGNKRPSDDLKTIPDCLRYRAESIPDQDAIIFYSSSETRQAVSWKDFYENSRKMARYFIGIGVKRREAIAVVARNCPEWLYVTFGAMMAGAHVTSLGLKYKDGSDLIEKMKLLQTCSLLVLDPGFNDVNWTIVQQLLDKHDADGRVSSTKLPYLRSLVCIGSPAGQEVKTVGSILEEKNEDIDLPEINPSETAILFPTSGSTGIPKLVAQTHAGLMRARELVIDCDAFGNATHLNEAPLGWVGGFPSGFMTGQAHLTTTGMVGPPGTDKLSFLVDIIKRERCKIASMAPTMIYELTKREKDLPPDWPLETVWTGGQPISKSLAACVGKVCKRLCIAYAGTEFSIGSAMIVENPDDFVEYASGLPPPGVELKIVDKHSEIVPAGERGEIYVRHEWVFKEYYNEPEKTASVKTEDEWVKTNDCGRISPNGFLIVEGRMSDIIISGGLKVTPALLETMLKKHPAIESAIVVPVPDDELHQAVCACVKSRSGCTINDSELRVYMEKVHNEQANLISILPKYYMILDTIPVESTGKISKSSLKKMAKQRFCEPK